MTNKSLANLIATLLIGLFLFACISTSSESGGNSPSGGDVPDNSQAPVNDGGQSSASGGGELNVQLPLSPDIPPADVIQQITWTGGGGGPGGPGCNSNCLNTNQTTISLTYFQPNQQLRIIIFYPTGALRDGAGVYEFLTEIPALTDNTGSVVVHTDRDNRYFQYIVVDDNGNSIYVPKGTGDLQYQKDRSDCPGQLPSRLSVGLKA